MTERGSGRTSRQLAALPDGAWFLVAHQREATYCQGLLMEMGRPRSAIIFVTPDISEHAILGRRPPAWGVDHAYFDAARSRDAALRAHDLIWMAAGRGPVGAADTY